MKHSVCECVCVYIYIYIGYRSKTNGALFLSLKKIMKNKKGVKIWCLWWNLVKIFLCQEWDVMANLKREKKSVTKGDI